MQRNTLIVRLATNQKKGDLLKKHNDVGYNKYVRERKEYVELVQDAWNQNFDFCRLRYMPDSLFQDFIDGVERPFFLNQFGKLDPNITMDTPYFYVVGSGSRDLEFKWYDAELALLTPQPPVVMNKYTIVELFMNKRKLLHLRIADINQYFKNVLNESKKG